MAANAADDARLAQQLHQAEMGYAPRVTQGTVVQGTVVQGAPAHAQPATIGAPIAPVRVAVVPDLPKEELVALSLRYSVLCLAVIDAVSTVLPALSALMADSGENARVQGVLLGQGDLRLLGVLQLALLVGPLCGVVGARTMRRTLVSAYLGFCIVNTFYKVAFALLTFWLWFILTAVIQLWVTKIVCRFWSALGSISAERAQEMRQPGFIEKIPVTMVYW